MSYSGRTSQDDRDEDDEDEYEEVDGSNRLLGFMFGNVDDSGDLDVDYLDEDAKEHLAALADKLGSSLTDIDLSAKSPRTPADAAEQDYDGKAEDAVDYVDIDEQYEGPETQVASEEDFLLPKKEYLSAGVSVAALERAAAVFDDENYDEDEEDENEHEVVDHTCDAPSISLTVDHKKYPGTPYEGDNVQSGPSEAENFDANLTDYQEEESHVLEEPCDGECPTHLPVLYIEDGMAILRFSEIFGIHEPLKKTARRAHKYAVARDKYKYMDAMNFVEEDEEAFLKSSFQGFSLMKQTHVSQDEITSLIDDERESAEASIFSGDNAIAMSSAERRKEYCLSATPMKENIVDEVLAGWASPLSPKFYPLDQQDWEDGIIWDNSPVVGRSSSESCITSKPNSEALVNGEIETWTAGQSFLSELQIHSDEKERPSFLHNSQLLMESFGSRESSQQANLLLSKRRYHPQILRLESPVEVDDSVPCDATMQKVGEENRPDYLSRHLGKLLPQNREIVDGSWLKNVIWEPHKNLLKPKLILDLQDEQMLFEIISTKEAKHLTLHARAMIMTRNMSRSIDFLDRHSHGAPSSGRFDIANDKFYSNRKTSQQLKSLSKKRTAHGIKVLHSVPALKLQTMKLKLSNKDISNFHRPKGLWFPHGNEVVLKEQARLSTQGPMKIILKSVGGKGSKVHVDAEETVSSLKEKASKKLDFKPSEPVKILYCGKELEDFKSLAVQNVQPNSLLHLVRTKIHLLPRAQKLPGANKSLRPPGAFKKKPDLSAKDGHVFLMEYCEERPLLLGNVGMGARLCTYYQKLTPDDQTGGLLHNENSKLGSILILDPADRSPFLGDIKPGCMQSSLETNMYRAPIFPHKVPLTDYLLVRSAKGKLSIRRIDRIDAVGQQEPHMEVMSPGSKVLQTYIMNRLLVHMYREFRTAKKHELHPFIRADELSAQFPNLSEAFLRKRFKHCADLQRGPNGEFCWFMRRNFHIPLEEELRRMVTPENVCAYESMQAGLYRLKHLGIRKLTQLTHISGAMNQLPDEAIALAAASHIERELQITPWNLSSNFVACTSQDRENLERLEITGVGDPSGRGLGFSYVRAVVKAPLSSAMMKTKTVVGQRGTTVTGTDADLRRLSMEAAREVLLRFNVPEEQIAKLTRWHRIAMIRKLSSEQAASGIKVDPTTISKFARGQRMSFLQLQQQAREKCQEIWDRQVQSLSAVDGDENESDSEANSDLDSFAGDLENLLDAEEFGAGEKDHGELIHEKADGVRGLKMRRHPSQAQTEEEIEDEAAEVAELCRMLLDDDETDKKKKKKTKPVANELPLGFENAEQVKRSTTLMKKISTSQPDAFLLLKESINKDRTEVENSHIKGNVAGKARAMKKNDVALAGSFSKKVKVIGDGVKIVKEKKPSRESFICGACGQLGHMRTNKNCPKYGEDIIDAQLEAADLDRAPARSFDSSSQPQPKPLMIKKIIPKTAAKAALLESSEGEKSILKPKTLKFKCGPIDKVCSKLTLGGTAEHPAFSDAETGEKSISKVNKIRIPNIMKPDELLIGPQKPSIVVRPPMSKEKNQVSANKLSSSVGLPGERDQAEYRKPNIVIRPPMEQPPRKITIKRAKEIIDLDQLSQDGSCGPEYRKTKKIAELSNIEKHGKQESEQFSEESSRWRPRKDKRWSEEEKTRRNAERLTEEGARRNYEERRVLEQQGSFAEIAMYGESIRQEWEEEERLKARKKKRKQKPAMGEYYLEDHMSRMRGRRIPERDCSAKMKSSAELRRYGEDYGPPTKRRRAGEVGLSNILEKIIEILKDKHEISYLFLKPVTKKEAPDYLNIIARPMDLSTIREKVRRFEYKNREEFRHDVWQITVNAHRYNDGRNPCIPPLADQLLELCDYLLYENRATLDEAEVGIEFRDI